MRPSVFGVLCLLGLVVLPTNSPKHKYPPGLVSAALRIVLREALDPDEELLCSELMSEIQALQPTRDSEALAVNLYYILSTLTAMTNITDFMRSLEKLLSYRVQEGPSTEPIHRRSPLGQFIRRQELAFSKLSFEGVAKLQVQIYRWRLRIDSDDHGLHPLDLQELKPLDHTEEMRKNAFSKYEAALASGDYTGTLLSLQKFFSYQFPKQDRALHQHALINAANFHLREAEFPACRRTLKEAIKIARSAGDKSCLEICMSLQRRLDAAEMGSSSLNTLSEEEILSLPALDQLWEIKRLLRTGEPVSAAVERLYLAMGRHEADLAPLPAELKEGEEEAPVRRPEVAESVWHAMHASLWDMMGEEKLAEYREDLCLSAPGGDVESRLAALQSKAMRLARQGRYERALSLLFLPDSVAGPSLTLYQSWAATLWDVLELQARRKGQRDVLEFIDLVRARKAGEHESVFAGEWPSSEEGVDGVEDEENEDGKGPREKSAREKVEAELEKGKAMKEARQPAVALPDVMSAMEQASQLGIYGLYRLTVVTFADVAIDMGWAAYAVDLIDEIYGRVLTSTDEELKGYASLTKARALIVRSLEDPDRTPSLEQALPLLSAALTSFATISLYSPHLHALELQASVLDALGRVPERDAAADEFARVEDEWEDDVLRGELLKGSIKEVWTVANGVMEVGVAISLGRV